MSPIRKSVAVAAILPMLLWAATCHGQRGVQISEIRFIDGDVVFEDIDLTNFGSTTEDMSNWRFCSHDDNDVRVYSTGIGGLIAPGETMTLRAFDFTLAQPFLGSQAYSLAIFDLDEGGFGGTGNIVDHLQWSIDGTDNANARFRSGQAVAGGVWTAADAWIPTSDNTGKIVLKDTTGGILHGPDDYEVIAAGAPPLPCDWDGDGDCDAADIDLLVANGTDGDGIATWLAFASDFSDKTYVVGDLNIDGAVDSTDLGVLLNNFGNQDTAPYSSGNVDGNQFVDSTDLGGLLNNFGFASNAASAVAVPEPNGCCYLVSLIGLVGFSIRRRA